MIKMNILSLEKETQMPSKSSFNNNTQWQTKENERFEKQSRLDKLELKAPHKSG